MPDVLREVAGRTIKRRLSKQTLVTGCRVGLSLGIVLAAAKIVIAWKLHSLSSLTAIELAQAIAIGVVLAFALQVLRTRPISNGLTATIAAWFAVPAGLFVCLRQLRPVSTKNLAEAVVVAIASVVCLAYLHTASRNGSREPTSTAP